MLSHSLFLCKDKIFVKSQALPDGIERVLSSELFDFLGKHEIQQTDRIHRIQIKIPLSPRNLLLYRKRRIESATFLFFYTVATGRIELPLPNHRSGVAFGGFPTHVNKHRFTPGLLPYACSNPRRRHRETLLRPRLPKSKRGKQKQKGKAIQVRLYH